MVKLRVAVRIIPEDGWLESQRTGAMGLIDGEKKFAVIVREPSEWYIGSLALEVQEGYRRRYKHELGKIKYLKAEDDCDLDPEDFVSDQLVDEGKAAKDGTDQYVTVKVIQEQGRAVRLGSVVPDLTPSHYQHPFQRPPVPRFSDLPSTLGKRPSNERPGSMNGEELKRQRLSQIREQGEDSEIVASIEQPNGRQSVELVIQDSQIYQDKDVMEVGSTGIKVESPELVSSWRNPNPATVDELEILPQKPVSFDKYARPPRNPLLNRNGSHAHPEPAEKTPRLASNESFSNDHHMSRQPLSERFDHLSKGSKEAVVDTPLEADRDSSTHNNGFVSILNGMKSASPASKQMGSSSAKKFRKPLQNIRAPPDSDIDDSQMSPESRAANSKIIPRLVQSSGTPDRPVVSALHQPRLSSAAEVTNSISKQDFDASETDDEDSDKENEGQFKTASQSPNGSFVRDRTSTDISVERAANDTVPAVTSSLSTPEIFQIQPDAGETKAKKRARRRGRNSRDDNIPGTTQDTHNVVASVKELAEALPNSKTTPKKKSQPKQRDAVRQLTPDSDGPGLQLSASLAQYTPTSKKAEAQKPQAKRMVSKPKTTSQNRSQPMTNSTTDTTEDAVMQPPVSSGEETNSQLASTQPMSTGKNNKKDKPSKVDSGEVRCYTCWNKHSRCDNLRPKCTSCVKQRKNCQLFGLTKAEADKISEERKANSTARKKKTLHLSEQDADTPSKKMLSTKKPSDGITSVNAKIAEPENHSVVTERASEKRSGLPDRPTAREQSVDTQVTTGSRPVTLPPGMTQEEYDAIVKSREGMTNDKRHEQKRSLQRKGSTPVLKRTPSRPSEGAGNPALDTSVADKTASTTSKSAGVVSAGSKIPTSSTSDDDEESNSPSESNDGAAQLSQYANTIAEKAVSQTPLKEPKLAATHSGANQAFKKPVPKKMNSATNVNTPLHSFRSLKELSGQLSQQNSARNSPRPSVTASVNTKSSLWNLKQGSKTKSFNLDDDSDEDSTSSDESSSNSDSGGGRKTVPAKKPTQLSTETPTQQKRTGKPDTNSDSSSSSGGVSESDSNDSSSDDSDSSSE